jgi:hypothetical protein
LSDGLLRSVFFFRYQKKTADLRVSGFENGYGISSEPSWGTKKNGFARSLFCDLVDCEAAQRGIALSYIESQAPPRNPEHWYDLLGDPAIDSPYANSIARSNVSFIAELGRHDSNAINLPCMARNS